MDVFTNISRYSKDQRMKFHLAMFKLFKLMTGSDLGCGPHINQKIGKTDWFYFCFTCSVNGQDVLTNVSRYNRTQLLKFGHLAVFDLPELMTGSDLNCGPTYTRKLKKTDCFYSHFTFSANG